MALRGQICKAKAICMQTDGPKHFKMTILIVLVKGEIYIYQISSKDMFCNIDNQNGLAGANEPLQSSEYLILKAPSF